MRNSIVVKGLLVAAAAAVPLLCSAESNVQTGANTAAPGATAHVDFQITIPKILYLRVGTGSSYTTGVLSANGTIDLIQFAPTAAVVGNGTAVAGTGGDQTNGVETAAVVSNSGNVTLNATATGALGDGPAGTHAGQRYQRKRGDHRAPDQSDQPGCEVDLRVRQHDHAAGRNLRWRERE